MRVFCFHYAGGGASVFRAWWKELPQGVEVLPVQLPGRESRFGEPLVSNMPALVPDLVQAIRPLCDRPFVFFGHSMGSLVAFEVAAALQREGLAVSRLLVSASRAPHLPAEATNIHKLPDAEFASELRLMKGTPEAVLDNAGLMELMMPVLRADFELVETYEFEGAGPLGAPITAIGGLMDADVGHDRLEPWMRHTTGDFRLLMLAGGHYLLADCSPLVKRLLRDEVETVLATY